MFLFMATSYAQWNLKIARPGSLDDSVDWHVEEGKGSCSVIDMGAGWQQGSLITAQWVSLGCCESSWSCPSITFLK